MVQVSVRLVEETFDTHEVEVAVPCLVHRSRACPYELIALRIPDDLVRDTLRLAQRRHGTPRPPLHHLPYIKRRLRGDGPSTLHVNLEDRSHDTVYRTMSDSDAWRHYCSLTVRLIAERKSYQQPEQTFELQLRDVGLEQEVDLRCWLFHGLLNRDGNMLEQLPELKLLLQRRSAPGASNASTRKHTS